MNAKSLGAAYVALSGIDTIMAGRPGRRARRVRVATKTLLMPTLAAAFALATQPTGPGPRRRFVRSVVVGQVLSWGGDVALLGRSERCFRAGLGSFLAAHVAYITGFASARDRGIPFDNLASRIAGGVWVTLVPALATAAGRRETAMRVPVATYGTVILTMAAMSSRLDPAIPVATRRLVVAGASLFVVSDAMIGVKALLLDDPEEPGVLGSAVMATYTAAQGLIALGVAGRMVSDTNRPVVTESNPSRRGTVGV